MMETKSWNNGILKIGILGQIRWNNGKPKNYGMTHKDLDKY